jgi:MFS transporter, PHS family, inorganic phosphate transporter
MMASIFLMQSLGQVTASAVAYGVAIHLDRCKGLAQKACNAQVAGRAVDQFWRTVIGVGAFPAAIAILLRFQMRESARWDLTNRGDIPEPAPTTNGVARPPGPASPAGAAIIRQPTDDSRLIGYFNYSDLSKYFWNGAWRRVLGVSLCWFILDICYYGLGLNSPRIISRLWKSDSKAPPPTLPDWNTDLVDPENATIFQILSRNSVRNIATVSTGTIAGSLAIIGIINFVPRVRFMAFIFVLLAVIFVITASILFSPEVYQGHDYSLTIFMYAFVQFLFNVGPNTLTWILPAEIFPTKYRGTFYGMAGACGKLGAIFIQGILSRAVHLTQPRAGFEKFAIPLYLFAVAMSLGAMAAVYFIPEVQYLQRHVEDEREGIFVPIDKRRYPLHGKYKNMVLERIEMELGPNEDDSREMDNMEPAVIASGRNHDTETRTAPAG